MDSLILRRHAHIPSDAEWELSSAPWSMTHSRKMGCAALSDSPPSSSPQLLLTYSRAWSKVFHQLKSYNQMQVAETQTH